MMHREVLRLNLRHDYFGDAEPPMDVVPSDPSALGRAGAKLRFHQGAWCLISDQTVEDLPAIIPFDVRIRTTDVLRVTEGADLGFVPIIEAPEDATQVELDRLPLRASDVRPGSGILARVDATLTPRLREVEVRFRTLKAHWAYHVVGPGQETAQVEDPEGEVTFETQGHKRLPDGRNAHVIRSREALPARARTPYRFSLTTPGPFGPTVLIPVLPAPGPQFITVPNPDTHRPTMQSDIYVSIF